MAAVGDSRTFSQSPSSSRDQPPTVIDLDGLRTRLDLPRETGHDPGAPPPRATPVLHAAVAVIARPAASGPEFLFIKRSVHDRDPWSGHIAFPGGKIEPQDTHLLHTARRETREETALVLPDVDDAGFLGRLPGVSPQGARRLPPLVVTPFLFEVDGGAEARVASREVERIHWVGLAHLLDPAARGTFRLPVGGAVRRFPAIDLGNEQIWGLTWRIVQELVGRVR